MITKTTERDLVEEVEELLAKARLPERLYDIPHPEYAGALHRISGKAGARWTDFGHLATVVPSCAPLFARTPDLLRRLIEDNKRLRHFTAEVADLGCLRGRRIHCVEREPTPVDWCVACWAKYLQERRDEEKQPTESI